MPKKPGKFDPPSLWIIGGANGSGKTTAYQKLTIEAPRGSIWIINPDDLSARIASVEKLSLRAANLAAVQRIEGWLYASVAAYQTIGVETVLSTPKYRRLVTEAKSKGFLLQFQYVYLDSSTLNVERVRTRAAKGGHKVPIAKILDRRIRSLRQFGWFFEQADGAAVFDNSGAEPVLKAVKQANQIHVYGDLIPEISSAIIPASSRA